MVLDTIFGLILRKLRNESCGIYIRAKLTDAVHTGTLSWYDSPWSKVSLDVIGPYIHMYLFMVVNLSVQ